MVRGVILAGGASSRMGAPKAALALDGSGTTFASSLIQRFLQAGIPDIVIVSGAAPAAVRRAVGRIQPPVRIVQNDGWEQGQLTSLIAGLEERAGDVLEAAMVTLVDTPLVRVDTLHTLLRTWRVTRAPIVRPARGGVHGHPVIFDASLFAALRAADPAVGAKAIVRAHEAAIVNVQTDDRGAFVDVDTPDDYERALRELRH